MQGRGELKLLSSCFSSCLSVCVFFFFFAAHLLRQTQNMYIMHVYIPSDGAATEAWPLW